MMKKKISTILKQAILEKNTNVAKMSRELGISHPTITTILEGEVNYLIGNVEKIADHLGIKLKVERATLLHDIEVEAFWALFEHLNISYENISGEVELQLEGGIVDVEVDYSFRIEMESPETMYTPATYRRVISWLELGEALFYEKDGEDFQKPIPIEINEDKLYRELNAKN